MENHDFMATGTIEKDESFWAMVDLPGLLNTIRSNKYEILEISQWRGTDFGGDDERNVDCFDIKIKDK